MNLRGSLNSSSVDASQSSPPKIPADETNIGSALNDPTQSRSLQSSLLQNGAAKSITTIGGDHSTKRSEVTSLRHLAANGAKEEWDDNEEEDDDDFVPTEVGDSLPAVKSNDDSDSLKLKETAAAEDGGTADDKENESTSSSKTSSQVESNTAAKKSQMSTNAANNNSSMIDTSSSMMDISSFTATTTLCQDDPNFIQDKQNCEEFVKGDKLNNCQVDLELVDTENGGTSKGKKGGKVKDVCKRSCGVCLDDDAEITASAADEDGSEEEKAEEKNAEETSNNKGGKSGKNNKETVQEVLKEDETIATEEATVEDLESMNDGDGGDDEENPENVTELEGGLTEDDEEHSLLKDGKEQEMDKETNVVDKKEEENGVDENAVKKTKKTSELEETEKEELVFKKADEDDAFIPEEEEAVAVVEEDEDEGANDELLVDESQEEVEVEEKEDLDSAQEEQETKTDANADEEGIEEKVAAKGKDGDQQLGEDMEDKFETVSYKDTFDDDKAVKIEKEMEEVLEESIEKDDESGGGSGGDNDGGSINATDEEEKVVDESPSKEFIDESPSKEEDEKETELAQKSADESVLCQDDPTFRYKGYEGFNCAYIKENKPDKCDKKHDGVKVGLSSCPVSCDMVEECMALQKQKNNAVVTTTGVTATEKSAEAVAADEEVSESEEEASAVAAKDNSDESESTKQKDDLELEKEMESKLETALEEGTVDEETAEKLDEEMFEALEEGVGEVFEKELEVELGLAGEDNDHVVAVESSNVTAAVAEDGDNLTTIDSPVVANLTISEDSSVACQDDPDFKFKGYEGFNCEYIKENKPEKCSKIQNGEKVGVVSCPVSCDMVSECMALHESKVDAALENAVENDETGSNDTSEEDTAATGATAEDTVDEGAEDALELKEVDEASDETTVQAVEGFDDTQVDAVGNTTEIVTLEEEAAATEPNTEKEDGGEELLKEQSTASSDEKSIEIDETTGLCQDDPDFKFKGYEGFNCEYIKENKPEKCSKIQNGEKVGVVSCPVSCNMVSECMALHESKGSADDTQFGSVEDETANVAAEEEVSEEMTKANAEASMVTNEEVTNEDEIVNEEEEGNDQKSVTTDKDETMDEANDETITTEGACQDDPDFMFKGYEGFNCEYIKENKPEKCNKLHNGEPVGVVSCPVSCNMVSECMALQQVKENSVDEVDIEENDESIGDETGSKDAGKAEVSTQAATVSSETHQDDSEMDEDQSLNDQELEQEIEAKLEKALEEGELDEEEAEELEVEMEEALEERVGEIFEAELDKELRCKDDPEFATVDEDGHLRNCSWVRQNQRCEH
eukprot:scaffold26702_cov104-Skeletonema_menzelii.AAC.3